MPGAVPPLVPPPVPPAAGLPAGPDPEVQHHAGGAAQGGGSCQGSRRPGHGRQPAAERRALLRRPRALWRRAWGGGRAAAAAPLAPRGFARPARLCRGVWHSRWAAGDGGRSPAALASPRLHSRRTTVCWQPGAPQTPSPPPPAAEVLLLLPALPLLPAEGGDDSAEYRSGEDDDADNEATIEEEEAMAAAEGRDVKVGCAAARRHAAGRLQDVGGVEFPCLSLRAPCTAGRGLQVLWACGWSASPHPVFCGRSTRRLLSWRGWMRRRSCRWRSCWLGTATTTWQPPTTEAQLAKVGLCLYIDRPAHGRGVEKDLESSGGACGSRWVVALPPSALWLAGQ
jgi:hypothetical protein